MLTLILAGGEGSRLSILGEKRAKPAVPFGGKYRIIDIPQMVVRDKVYAYPFAGYWVDVGTIQAYWETNLALLEDQPALDLYDALLGSLAGKHHVPILQQAGATDAKSYKCTTLPANGACVSETDVFSPTGC